VPAAEQVFGEKYLAAPEHLNGPTQDHLDPRATVYHHGVDPVTAFILAGGKSSRMGRDKAFLQLGGRTLLARALDLAGAVTANTRIVGSPEKFAEIGPVVQDIYPGRGPLAAIHAALTTTDTERNLVLAVDMPFLRPDFLYYLVSRARETSATVVLPRAATGLQPLCAVYDRKFAGVAKQSLRAGRNKIDTLFMEVETRILEPEELARNGFGEEMFCNLNTEEEWQEAGLKLSAKPA
jgi:molybdenum cofactor guanylyltransferase